MHTIYLPYFFYILIILNIIRYRVGIFFPLTFRHFTSYIFCILLFANCNLVYFLLSLIIPTEDHKIQYR